MENLTVPAFIIAMPFLFLGFVSQDMLIYRLYKQDNETWKKIGSPIGMLWKPKELSWFSMGSFYSGRWFMLKSLFTTPECLKSDYEAYSSILKVLRIGCFGFWICLMIFVISINKA